MLFLFQLQCISSRHNSHRKSSSIVRRDTSENGKKNEELHDPRYDRQFEKLIQFAPDYNIHEHPAPKNGTPLDVDFQINLRNLLEVNEVSQICTLETTIRMFWLDERVSIQPALLKNNSETEYITLNPKAADNFWIPDIFVDQAKALRIPTYFVRPASIRVYNNSKIRYATRVNFDVACKMEFHQYPTDMQTCEIKLESFGYTSKQMRFKWMSGNNINQNISLPQFDLDVKLGDNYATDYYELAYPGVIMRIILKRKISFHLVQTYVPSSIFVCLAWLSVFVPPEQVPGRVTMTMTTLLTLTAMFGSVRSNVPRVSYISLLDIWMFMCIVFVFIVIIHFVVVISLLRYGHKKAAEAVEIVGALLVPILFITFNVFYWLNLLRHTKDNNMPRDEKFDWN